MNTLTKRELEILGRVVLGQKRSLIADDLGITVRTVHWHLENVRGKLDVQTLIEAVVCFVRRRKK